MTIEQQFQALVEEFQRTCPVEERRLLEDLAKADGVPIDKAYRLQVVAMLSQYAHRPHRPEPLLTWAMRGMWHRMLGDVYLSTPASVLGSLADMAVTDGQTVDALVAETLLHQLDR